MGKLTTIERFEKYVVRGSGCWEWRGTRNGQYGSFRTGRDSAYGRANVYAHRFAFEVWVRELQPGEHLHHSCENKLCVNPAHLEALSAAGHMRAHGMGERLAAYKRARTHCKRGHEFTPENTIWLDGGKRRSCRLCTRKRTREGLRRLRARRATEVES